MYIKEENVWQIFQGVPMKKISEMSADELNKALNNILKDFDSAPVSHESALDSQGNFKKFSLYEDFDIGYAVNATTH